MYWLLQDEDNTVLCCSIDGGDGLDCRDRSARYKLDDHALLLTTYDIR